ncbi:MAG: hypothetical protein Kow0088_24520 [Anaerolineales bacterium]
MIRPLNPRQDLLAVADLIELCFADTLDQSGRDYIQQLRQVAKEASGYWIGRSGNHIYAPREGFVWEEEGRIVGNLSIFRFRTGRSIEYLIANVAVHPDYRRRGIARSLTERAIEYIRAHGGRQAWLNVREDNHAAYSLYRRLNFSERLRRTHWQLQPPLSTSHTDQNSSSNLLYPTSTVRRRSSADWEYQRQWLLATYPEDYHWHLDFRIDWFAPGLLALLKRLLNDTRLQHYSITKGHKLIGVASIQSSLREEQALWMACDPQWENEAFSAFLNHFSHSTHSRRIILDYPAYHAVLPLQEFGFTPIQTLIWMQLTITRTMYINLVSNTVKTP